MAFLRSWLALLPLLTMVFAADATPAGAGPSVQEIVTKARAALTSDPAKLASIKSQYIEFTASEVGGRPSTLITLTLVSPAYRLLRSYDNDRHSESIICAGRLDGWMTRKPDALSRRELKVIPFEEFKKLQDMARDDLAFFAVPEPKFGQATFLGTSEVAGHPTLMVQYAYRSGFSVTRHFDAQTFALVASDQRTPDGKIQRQQVVSMAATDGVQLPTKEAVFIDGKQTGEVTYRKVTFNADNDPKVFDFPTF
ncbi:MAG: hypothetical protein WCJ96_02985 [Verrucomicrobiota bacterium]|jgi:hypothetical protein